MSTIKVGLIGFGMAGRVFHAPLIEHVAGLVLAAVRETKADNIRLIKQRYPHAAIVDSTAAILQDNTIDLVVIAAPNKFHFSLAKQALMAGKHVVVDKPFTVTSLEAELLIKLSKVHKKLLSIYQNRRWDSDFLTVSKVIGSGKLGRLVEYEAYYARFRNYIKPNSWKEDNEAGTGLLYDLGAHLIDQALVLFGNPKSITADMRTQRDNSNIIDHFHLMLDYGQLKVTLRSGMLIKEPLPRFTLLGTNGTFVKYGQDVQEQNLNEAELPLNHINWGIEPKEVWGALNTVQDGRVIIESEKGDYATYYTNVLLAIKGKAELIVKAEQALNTIRLIEYAFQSNEEKRTVAVS